MTRRYVIALLALAWVGCGPGEDLASVGASLLIPRQLAEQIKSVEVYLFQTSAEDPYDCDELAVPANFDTFRSQAFKVATIDFDQGVSTAVFDNIPDRGMVWRFFARAYDAGDSLIAQGCDKGLYRLEGGKTQELTIQLTAYP